MPPLPPDLMQALLNPTAPLPAGWPVGAWGAFLLFMVPVGGGIPVGVLMAHAAGVSLPTIALLYLLSDVVLALTAEPVLIALRWVGRWVPALARIGERLARFTQGAGFQDSGARGPLGLILVSFTISPTTGRAATAAAGHGFLTGWTLAIVGDMLYFLLLMTSTLWLSSVIGDQRLTVGIVLMGTWLLPLLLRRLHSATRTPAASRPPLAEPQPVLTGPGSKHGNASA